MMSHIIDEFAKKIKEYRNKKGYTQENLAELCSVSRQAVAKWEAGKNIPDIDSIVLLAKLFEVDIECLLGLETESEILSERDFFSYKLINKGIKQALNEDSIDEVIKSYMDFILKSIGAFRISIYEYIYFSNVFHNTYKCKLSILKENYEVLDDIPAEKLQCWRKSFENQEWIYIDNIKKYIDNNLELKKYLYQEAISSIIIVPILKGKAFVRIDNIPLAFITQIKEFYEVSIDFIECFLKRRIAMQEAAMEKNKCLLVSEMKGCFTYSCNLKSGTIKFDDNFYDAFNIAPSIISIQALQSLLCKNTSQDVNAILGAIYKVIDEHKNRIIETIYFLASGNVQWLKISLCPFVNKESYVEEIYGTIENVSEMHDSIKQYNSLVRNGLGGYYRCNLSEKAHTEYVSDSFLHFVGYSREEYEKKFGDNYLDLVYEDDRNLYQNFIQQDFAAKKTHMCKYRICGKYDKVKYVIDTMEAVLDEEGTLYGYSVVVDICGYEREKE